MLGTGRVRNDLCYAEFFTSNHDFTVKSLLWRLCHKPPSDRRATLVKIVQAAQIYYNEMVTYV